MVEEPSTLGLQWGNVPSDQINCPLLPCGPGVRSSSVEESSPRGRRDQRGHPRLRLPGRAHSRGQLRLPPEGGEVGEEGEHQQTLKLTFMLCAFQVKFVCCGMFCLAFGAALALNKVDSREAVKYFHQNISEIVKGATPDILKDEEN